MKKTIFKTSSIIILALLIMSTTGAAASTVNNDGKDVQVTQLEQINSALQTGPVLLSIGSESCDYCQKLKPILNELATEYNGKATIMSIDIDKSPNLKDYFGVSSVPDSSVIVRVENGTYVYMQANGKTSTERFQARILGLRDKQVFKEVLDLALKK